MQSHQEICDVKLCLDLGAGLGGASAAFRDSPDWAVVTLDIDRKFKPTVQADYSHLPFRTALQPEMVLSGPDCACFSIMALRHHWKTTPTGPEPKDVRTIDAIRDTEDLVKEIKRLDPTFAVVENPTGMMRHVLGKPQHAIRMSDYGSKFKKPTDLWEFGRLRLQFAWLEGQRDWVHIPRKRSKRHKDKMGVQGVRPETGPGSGWKGQPSAVEHLHRAPALRAKWPYGLSKAIKEAADAVLDRMELLARYRTPV
jgi:hypothetical protein